MVNKEITSKENIEFYILSVKVNNNVIRPFNYLDI